MKKSRTLVFIGLIVALDVILGRYLSIKTPIIRIGFAFIAVAFGGILLGPAGGGICSALGDIFGYLLFPSGAYMPGITLNAFLAGAVYGLFLHGKRPSVIRVAIACAVTELVVDGLLTTFWLYLLMPGKTFLALFTVRIVKSLIMVPIQTLAVYLFWRSVDKVPVFRRTV